jgi:serine/threonine protein phosphatase PrpC
MSSAAKKPAAGGAGSAAVKTTKATLRQTRRRLSVVSDNKLIEGIATIGTVEHEETLAHMGVHVVKAYAGVSKKGYAPYNPRKRNQDALMMEEHKPSGAIIFGVYDGHGEAGDLVSHYFTERMPARLVNNPRWVSDPGAAMRDEVDKLEKQLLSDASIDTEFSGSTCVMGLVRGKTLTVANIGDSRVILGRRDPRDGRLKAVEVSEDHKPDREDEEKRIVARGGRVFAVEYDDGIDGPPRVWLGHMDIPGLAMSRSLGDTVAHTAGVISEPEMHVVELTPADKIMIWASDGLWEFMSNQEVLDMISGIDDPKRAVDVLVAEANARWMKEEQVIDDTTVIVAFLDVPA